MDIVKCHLVLYYLSFMIVVTKEIRPPGRSLTEEEILLKLLFDGYNPSARPVLNSAHTVQVGVQFSLLQIQELNLKSQVFTTTGLLILEWTDERLRWNMTKFPMRDIVVEARKIWRPEFASINGANDIYGDYGQFRAVIQHTGKVHWEPGGVFKTICEIDITYYPFDEQCCNIIFGAWSYHTSKMNLTNLEASVNMDSFESNGEWEIYRTIARRNESVLGSAAQEKFSNVEFRIYIRRRYTFYILNVILPSIMTSILLLSVFFSTPAQKVQIGVVVLLSFRIFLLNVTDSIPKTSDHIPLLGVYLACTMAITTLSMVLTVYVLNLYGIADRPVPTWANHLVMVHIARLVCMQRFNENASSNHLDNASEYTTTYRATGTTATSATVANDFTGTCQPVAPNSLFCYLSGMANGTAVASTSISNHSIADIFQETELLPRRESDYLRESRDQQHGSFPDKNWAKDWQRIAEVVDRLFFWVFLFGVVVTTLLLFHPLARSNNEASDNSGEISDNNDHELV